MSRTIRVGRTLEDRADELQRELDSVRRQQANCAHEWGPVKYDPRVTGGYSESARMVNTYGHEPPSVWVPRREVQRWTRTCTVCGVRQSTERTRSVTSMSGGLKSTTEAPDFGGQR